MKKIALLLVLLTLSAITAISANGYIKANLDQSRYVLTLDDYLSPKMEDPKTFEDFGGVRFYYCKLTVLVGYSW